MHKCDKCEKNISNTRYETYYFDNKIPHDVEYEVCQSCNEEYLEAQIVFSEKYFAEKTKASTTISKNDETIIEIKDQQHYIAIEKLGDE